MADADAVASSGTLCRPQLRLPADPARGVPLSTLTGELDRNAALRETRDQDATALRLADLRFKDGSISILELLDSQRQLIGNENALASSDQLLADDETMVFQALGGGWQDGPAPDIDAVYYPRGQRDQPPPPRPMPTTVR